MSRNQKIMCSVIAFVFSFLAVPVGFSLVGGAEMSFTLRFLCNFVFIAQFLGTIWIIISMFRKDRRDARL